MSSDLTCRDAEPLALELMTQDWMDLMSLATAFGWRSSITEGGVDVYGRSRPSLAGALELAKAAMTAAPEERQEILQLDVGEDHCSCCDDIIGIRESVISGFLADFGRDDSISYVDWFIDVAQDLQRLRNCEPSDQGPAARP